MSKIIEVTDQNFEEVVVNSDKPVLVDFAAEWCGPCKRLAPIIEELADEYDGKVVVCHVDVDNAQDAARKFQVMSIPTVMLFKNGEPVQQQIGLVPKGTLAEMIDS
jgi:thioredoxin